MKNRIMYAMVFAAIAAVLGGCNMPDKDTDINTAKKEAYKSWAKSRVELYTQLATDNYKAGRLDEAKEKVKEVIKLEPDNESARLMLAKINIEQGLYDVACKELEHILALNSQSYEAFYLTGVALEQKGKLDQALTNYEHASQINPRDIAPVLASAEVMVKLDRSNEALMLIERKIKMSNDRPETYELAGRIAMLLGEPGKAVTYFQRACDVDYRNKRYPEMLAQAQKESGNPAAAATTMRRILQSRKKNEYQPWMFIFLGDCDLVDDNPREAFLAYRKACNLDKKDTAAWVGMAQACIVLKQYVTAANSAVEALRIKPDDLPANLVYSYALLKLNRHQQAIERLEKVAKLYPQNSTVCYLLARGYTLKGDKKQAKQQLNKALESHPESHLARQMLAKSE